MRTMIVSCFTAAVFMLTGCVASDYGGWGGQGLVGRRTFAKKFAKKRGWSQDEQAAPASAGVAPVEQPAAPVPPPPPAQERSISGIGARLQVKDGAASIAAILPGGPAAKDGRLQVGDLMTAVAQGDGPWASTEGMSQSQIVALVRGDSGTIVRLKALRDGFQTITVSLVRASVQAAAEADIGTPATAVPASSSAPAPRPVPQDSPDISDQLKP